MGKLFTNHIKMNLLIKDIHAIELIIYWISNAKVKNERIYLIQGNKIEIGDKLNSSVK